MTETLVVRHRIKCYDGGENSGADRYTVVYLDSPVTTRPGFYDAVGMNAAPYHPQGFGQHCNARPGRHRGRRIKFKDLPRDCQRLVWQDLGASQRSQRIN